MADGQVVNSGRTSSLPVAYFPSVFVVERYGVQNNARHPQPDLYVPEQAAARAGATDVVGNLGVDGTATWALPMSESGGS